MSLDELRELMKAITYKPGARIGYSLQKDKMKRPVDVRFLFSIQTRDATKFRSPEHESSVPEVLRTKSTSEGGSTWTNNSVESETHIFRTKTISYGKLKEFSRDQLLNFLLCELIDLERHEAIEFFKLNGVCVQAPHDNTPCVVKPQKQTA